MKNREKNGSGEWGAVDAATMEAFNNKLSYSASWVDANTVPKSTMSRLVKLATLFGAAMGIVIEHLG